jgi:O-antigen/teichoic acid export membrane protein
MVFPSMVEHVHEGNDAGIRDDLRFSVRVSALPLFLLAAVGGGIATGALQVFGEGFDQAADAFALLLLAYCLSAVSLLFGDVFLARGKPSWSTALVIVRSVLTIGLMVPFVVWWDATGAGAAIAVAYAVDVAVRMEIVRRTELGGRLGSIGRAAVAVIVGGVPAFVAARWLDTTLATPLGTILGGAVGAAVYVGIVLAIGGVTVEERAAVRRRLRRGAAVPTPPPS